MAAPANTTQSQAEPLATALGPPNHPPGAMLMRRAAWISTERHESASPSWERSATTSKESDPAGTRRRAQSLLTAARVRREFGPSRLRTRVSASVTQTKRLRFRSREWSRPKAARTSGHIRGQGGASMRPFAAVFAARPLSLAGILANSGAPFAAPKAHERHGAPTGPPWSVPDEKNYWLAGGSAGSRTFRIWLTATSLRTCRTPLGQRISSSRIRFA